MKEWGRRVAALAGQLAALDGVDPQWAAVFADVPRHIFVPRFYSDVDGPQIVDGTDPGCAEEWLDGVYSDESLVTQCSLIPGSTDLWQSASSSTRPSLMARMLTLLDVHDGQSVLEIGTGTGYNAALLCRRLGSSNVASVDIDDELVGAARWSLSTLGLYPALAATQGAAGFPEHAPYDRIIATCAVRTIPPAWVAQLRPDGLIVADLRGELASNLLVARGNGDGTVSGRFLAEPGHFMWLRAQADNPLRDGGRLATRIDYDDARTTTTQLNPAILAEPAFRFLLQLTAPNVGQIWTAIRDGRTLVRVSGDGGAWADLDPATGALTQGGPVDLFEYIDYAAGLWDRLGYPEPGRFGITAGPVGQTGWLDSPQHPVPTMTS
ncbi:MAG TPA: methyltransferase domain-containing protein [Pseudonocardiaceae bacterium]|nr:methyltransferase domain-containing protein [Pseudonocardiaceae bacterium]